MTTAQHKTVLLTEAVEALVHESNGFYVDATFGRGGHSREILNRLDADGRLLAVDKDPQAVAAASGAFANDNRFEIVQGSFSELRRLIEARQQVGKTAGILLDLGVSSPQLDDPERGFSFSHDGPLDMRMDTGRGESAAQWIASVKESELARVLKQYGDERYAKRIAKAIVAARQEQAITRTAQLAKIIADAHPAWEVGKHPATRAFLAIRLYINRELEDLTTLLDDAVPILQPGGRLVVISFHSLEDRIVKRFMRRQAKGDPLPAKLPVKESQLNKTMRLCGKPVRAADDEVSDNVRSRSAIMRVAEKL